MRRPGGTLISTYRDGSETHCDTFTCAHGNEIVMVRPGQDPAGMGAHCKTCDALICAKCAATGSCTPFERRLEASETRDRFFRSIGLG